MPRATNYRVFHKTGSLYKTPQMANDIANEQEAAPEDNDSVKLKLFIYLFIYINQDFTWTKPKLTEAKTS